MAEVDSVLTSGEVQQLLEAHSRVLGELPSARPDSLVDGVEEDGQLYGLPGGSGAAMSVLLCSIRPPTYQLHKFQQPVPLEYFGF